MDGALGMHVVNLVEEGHGTESELVIILHSNITENLVQDHLLNHHPAAL